MKKAFIAIGLCAVFLSMPTLLAFPTAKQSSLLYSPFTLSDGTFAGGLGRGHWGNGKFNIDTVYAYMSGVYTSGPFIRISGDITKDYSKIGEINAIIGYRIIYGYIKNAQGLRGPMIGFLMRNQQNQFVGRIMSIIGPAPHIWGYFVPNK